MLTPAQSLALSYETGEELPRLPELKDLYSMGVQPRKGQVIMIVGRSGAQKSGFALWWVEKMRLPTLYVSADMSPFTASARLASMLTGETTQEIEAGMARHPERYVNALSRSQVHFTFGSPIRWRTLEDELDAWVELHNDYPAVIVLDNLMDFEGGAEADYGAQMEVMQGVTAVARDTGAAVVVLHHASDKSWDAVNRAFMPPSRDQVKGGMSEKSELTLSVAIEPGSNRFRISCIKQRMGPSDPTANTYAVLQAVPELTRFAAL